MFHSTIGHTSQQTVIEAQRTSLYLRLLLPCCRSRHRFAVVPCQAFVLAGQPDDFACMVLWPCVFPEGPRHSRFQVAHYHIWGSVWLFCQQVLYLTLSSEGPYCHCHKVKAHPPALRCERMGFWVHTLYLPLSGPNTYSCRFVGVTLIA